MSETSAVVKPILDYCAKSGIMAFRRNVAGVRKMRGSWVKLGVKGQADIWLILKGGRHGECECKLPGEELNEDQKQWLEDCARQGAFCFWVTSLDEFIECMTKAQTGQR